LRPHLGLASSPNSRSRNRPLDCLPVADFGERGIRNRAALPSRRRLLAIAFGAGLVPILCSCASVNSAPAKPLATSAACTAASAYPSPDTHTASPTTQISFRNIASGTAETDPLTVSGSATGSHQGRWVADSDNAGASFYPGQPFRAAETVTVSARFPICGARGDSYHFSIARPPGPLTKAPASKAAPVGPQPTTTYLSMPKVQVPKLKVDVPSSLGGGYVFLEPKGGTKLGGPEIVNGEGQLVWFDPLPPEVSASDLAVQTYQGQPSLTWWKGEITGGTGAGEDLIMNSSYQVVATVKAGNGYQADLHVFKLSSDDTAWITAYHAVGWNLKSAGGPKDGAALDAIVQEVDIATGNVLFEWHSLDHVAPNQSYINYAATADYDYFHVNSIDPLPSGTVLVSSRNTNAAYDVAQATGQVIWWLGGKKSSFTMEKGANFALQHDVEMHGPNTFSIFDDEDATKAMIPARAVVLHVNFRQRRVTLQRALSHDGLVVNSQGNTELLPGGDDFVGWGAGGAVSEYGRSGKLLFDAHYAARSVNSYRAFLFHWTGTPATAPSLAEQKASSGGVTIYASWNGSTETRAWEVLGGSDLSDLQPLTTVKDDGFQTAIHLASSPAVVKVVAEGAGGQALGTSAALTSSAA
jgi:hypothetical protein